MACTNHPAISDDIQVCATCSKPFCRNCLIVFQGKRICGGCKNERIRAVQSGMAGGIGELEYATLSRRFSAMFLDGLVVGVPLQILGFAVAAMSGPTPDVATSVLMLAITGLQLVVPFVYEGVMVSNSGQTLGKKWTGIKVVQADGSAVTGGQSWKRILVKTLISGTCLLLGYITAGFNKEKKTWHDSFAKTRVVRA